MIVSSLFPDVFVEACCGKGLKGNQVFDPNYKPLQELCLKIWDAALAASDTNGYRVTCENPKPHKAHMVLEHYEYNQFGDLDEHTEWYQCQGVQRKKLVAVS